MYMYCLFCQTQKCGQIATTIEQLLSIRVINPKIIQRYWKKGKEELREHNYMPGYLFLYADEPIESFKDVNRISGVIRRLGTSDTGYDLRGVDRDFAQMLLNLNGTIGVMKTYQEGDTVKLASFLYQGFSGEIKRLDRKKGRAQIEFEFDGSTQSVWVGYENIEMIEDVEAKEEVKAEALRNA